jgi:anion-transporting  ArsA/GET3 family ATPase
VRTGEHAMTTTLDSICSSARVIVACGTGGVGKTSVAAALGVHAARAGRKVVVITIDPARRLADAIGLDGALGNEPQKVALDASGELWVTMLDVRETFDNLVRETSPTPERAREVMENSFYRSLSRSLSGTRDYMAAERLHGLQNDSRFDLVIVDTPPSRNALDFLESPERLARFLKHPVVRLLVAPSRGGLRFASAAMTPVLKAISSVVGSDALTGVAAFLRAFDGMETEFSRRALAVAAMLRGNDTHFVVVTAPSPDALKEADHFVSELSRLGIELRLLVANRMPPRFGSSSSTDEHLRASQSSGEEAALHSLLASMYEDAERAEAGVDAFVQRTRTTFPQVPLASATELAEDIHSMDSIGVLAHQLAVAKPQL